MLRILKDNGLIIRGWDNLSRVRGVVTRSQKGGFVLKQDPEKEVFIATNEETEFKNFYLDQRIAKENVNIIESDYIDAIGEVTSEGLYATLIYYGHPSDQSSYETKVTSGQVTKQKVNGISPLVICTYTYYGTATWFNCPVGAGRCGCKGTTNEIAWPAMDDCGCCNSKCADCSSGCKNQIRIQCGAAVIVEDLCNNRWKTFGVRDAGPCQKANCGGCSPQLCGRVCSDSLGYNTPIVDLTKVSFAAWYDPAKRGCFSCKASYMTPC